MKKCPVCSREYRDVVSLCPFDGAGLAPAALTPPSVEPQAEFVEPFAITPEVEVAPIVEPVELFPVSIVDMVPETAQFERPPLYDMPEEDLDEAVTEIMAEPPRVATPTTLLSEPPREEPDMEATFIRAPITITIEEEPIIPPSPPAQDYRPNAANAASLPYTNDFEESKRPAYNPNVAPVIPPLGAGRPPMPPARESNPWQWATFGLAGLMLVFAGAWFFLGGSRPGANANDPLATDPNAANVNLAPPITGMENGLPPPDANINSGNLNSLPLPLPGAGTGPNLGGSTGPFPTGPPPSLSNINQYPPPVINSNAPNGNLPNFNSGGVKGQPTPLPATTPKPLTTPSVAPTPLGAPKPVASPKPAITPVPVASPKPSVKPAASPKPTGTPSGPEPLR